MALARISVAALLCLIAACAQDLSRAAAILESEVKQGRLQAASILVAHRGKTLLHRGFGAAQADSIYQVASITKPVTATALMLLVERGQVSLNDPVRLYLPDFTGGDRDKVRVRDLLAHTSGLPDMLPENVELRRAHAPLSEFVKRTYTTPLLFPPGSEFRYQSMGVLLAAQIVEKIGGMPLPAFEQKEIFGPLRMKDTVLGLGKLRIEDTIPIGGDSNSDFGANSPYWRNMAHPWGGLHTTVTDLAILMQAFLNGGRPILSAATVRAMLTDQNARLNAPWGLGWALGRAVAWNGFGDLVSPQAFGHSGASGTVVWADPRSQTVCVILTNRPWSVDEGRLLRLVSNAVAAAVAE